jgi:hypothetical protein
MKAITLQIQAQKQGLIALIQLLRPEVESDSLGELSIDELYDLYLKLRA